MTSEMIGQVDIDRQTEVTPPSPAETAPTTTPEPNLANPSPESPTPVQRGAAGEIRVGDDVAPPLPERAARLDMPPNFHNPTEMIARRLDGKAPTEADELLPAPQRMAVKMKRLRDMITHLDSLLHNYEAYDQQTHYRPGQESNRSDTAGEITLTRDQIKDAQEDLRYTMTRLGYTQDQIEMTLHQFQLPERPEKVGGDSPYDTLRRDIAEVVPRDGRVPEFHTSQERDDYIARLRALIQQGRNVREGLFTDDVAGANDAGSGAKLDVFNQLAELQRVLDQVENGTEGVQPTETENQRQVERYINNVNRLISRDATGMEIKEAILQLATVLEQQGLVQHKDEVIEAGVRMVYGPTRSEGIRRWGNWQDNRYALDSHENPDQNPTPNENEGAPAPAA